jgi:hypothetical protein
MQVHLHSFLKDADKKHSTEILPSGLKCWNVQPNLTGTQNGSKLFVTRAIGLVWTLSIVLWLRPALSNGPNWVGLSCQSTWGRRQIQSPKRCGLLSSTYKTMDRVQNKPNSRVQHTSSSESFQVYLFVTTWTRNWICLSVWLAGWMYVCLNCLVCVATWLSSSPSVWLSIYTRIR